MLRPSSSGFPLFRGPVGSLLQLYHGTSEGFARRILKEGLAAGSYLTSLHEIAAEYAVAASDEDAGERTSEGVVLQIDGVPATSEWLEHDGRAMDEPVAPFGLWSGTEMDLRASRALGQFKRRHPESYDPETDTVSVPLDQFQVSLNAVASVRVLKAIPATNIRALFVLEKVKPFSGDMLAVNRGYSMNAAPNDFVGTNSSISS